MLKDAEKLERDRAWVHDHAAEYNLRQQLLLKNGPRQEDGTLNMYLSAPYSEEQSLMHYVPKSEFLSKQTEEDARRPPKAISVSATRIGKAFELAQHGAAALAAAATGLRATSGARAGASVPASPRVNGFGFLCTPSPCPGVDDDPLFTWGAVEGTPLLLPEDDCPGFNPFRVQQPSARERVAAGLGAAAGHKRPASALRPASRPATPGGPRLSEAARKLARRALGAAGADGGGGVAPDPQLRASYRRATTPHAGARGATPRTPALGGAVCPSPARRDRTPRLAAHGGGGGGGATQHLTDGLLEL
jgi:protein DGCR14